MEKYDLIVIGAGPGGYVAAIKAAQMGLKAAVIEKQEVGGTCLNRGCIPTKALLHASGLLRKMKECEAYGLHAENIAFDLEKLYAYKDNVTSTLRNGIEQLMKSNKITLIYGRATIGKDKTVTVTDGCKIAAYEAEHILIATGSKPVIPPIDGIHLNNVITSDELLSGVRKLYPELVIIGGGVISVEFATIFQTLGCNITILEVMNRILPTMDKEISQNLKMILKRRGVNIQNNATVKNISKSEDNLICFYEENGEMYSIKADGILVAAGRQADVCDLFENGMKPDMQHGRILTDENYETTIKGIYAIGDVIKGIQLAHNASAQGIAVAEYLCNRERSIDLSVIPSCVYTDPEIACVGLNEDQAKERGIPIRTGKFTTTANGKSIISKQERGFVKLIFDQESDRLLGAQLMCARATDMIGEMGTLIANRMTAADMLKAMRAHPTYNEMVAEAVEDYYGSAIHAAVKRMNSINVGLN